MERNNILLMKTCKICNQEKELDDFYTEKRNGKVYHKNQCKKCYNANKKYTYVKKDKTKVIYIKNIKSIPRPINKSEFTNEIREFLKKIEHNKGYIDIVDSYRLTSYYIDVFGYENPIDMDIKVELEYYYNKLLELM